MRYLAVAEAPDLPRRVRAYPGFELEVGSAMDRWNALRPGLFEWAGGGQADVVVTATNGRTWVDFNSAWPLVGVYCGPDLQFWMPHELGHALGLADHVPPGWDTTQHVNPVVASEAYRGIMSYQATLADWFGPDDVKLVRAVFPFAHQGRLPGIAADR